jgi:thiamine-phosphate pyrophosphorylase
MITTPVLYPMLCLVTHMQHQTLPEYLELVQHAVLGGVSCVQFRDKSPNKTLVYTRARALQNLLKPLHVPLIINDSIELAHALQADGVHLGQSDTSPNAARMRLGPNACIGLSIESMPELLHANTLECIDYVAASAVFESQTKTNCKTLWGLDGLRRVVHHAKHPVLAIGGIHLNNIHDVMLTGVSGIAVVSAIHHANNIQTTTNTLRSYTHHGNSSYDFRHSHPKTFDSKPYQQRLHGICRKRFACSWRLSHHECF